MKKSGTRASIVKDGTLIVTVDIGMRTNHGYCTAADGRSSKTFKFENTRQGFEALWTMVLAGKAAFGCNEAIVGYESTGPYGEPLIHYLRQKDMKSTLIYQKVTAQHRQEQAKKLKFGTEGEE